MRSSVPTLSGRKLYNVQMVGTDVFRKFNEQRKWLNLNVIFLTRKYPFLTEAEAIVWRCSIKRMFLKISQNTEENTSFSSARVSFLIKVQALTCDFIKIDLVQMFCCEFRETFKSNFFTKLLRVIASI